MECDWLCSEYTKLICPWLRWFISVCYAVGRIGATDWTTLKLHMDMTRSIKNSVMWKTKPQLENKYSACSSNQWLRWLFCSHFRVSCQTCWRRRTETMKTRSLMNTRRRLWVPRGKDCKHCSPLAQNNPVLLWAKHLTATFKLPWVVNMWYITSINSLLIFFLCS